MENKNSIFAIAPYKWNGLWVFNDERVGLDKEALVAGADTTLDLLSKNADKCVVLFSINPFKGYQIKLGLLNSDPDNGSDYVWAGVNENGEAELHDVWLCPALFLYYPDAPKVLYVQVKSIENGNN